MAARIEDSGQIPVMAIAFSLVLIPGLFGWFIFSVFFLKSYEVSGWNALFAAFWFGRLFVIYLSAKPFSDVIKVHDEHTGKYFENAERYENANCRLVLAFTLLAFLSLGLAVVLRIESINNYFIVEQQSSLQWVPIAFGYLMTALIIQKLNAKTSLHEAFSHAVARAMGRNT